MSMFSVAQALAGHAPEGGQVTVKGWVPHPPRLQGRAELRQRQRWLLLRPDPGGRAGHPAQLRVRVKHLTTGCAVIATGTLVKSQGQGQSFEVQGIRHRGRRLGRGPADLPDAAQAAFAGIPARVRPPAPAHQPVRRGDRIRHCLAQAVHRFFHERQFYWISTPIITTSDAEGRRADVPGVDLDTANLPRDGKARWISAATSSARKPSDRVRPAQRRGLLPVVEQGHLRPHLPAPRTATPRAIWPEFWMIRAGDRVRRPQRRRQPRRGLPQYLFRAVLDERGDDMAFIAERVQKIRSAAWRASSTRRSSASTTPMRSRCCRSPAKFEFPVEWGLDLQTEHERWLTEDTS